jgi:glutamate-ammonia-ligase adenylyltransferase
MHEDDTHLDLKHGPGGSDDLDSIIQQAQLMNAHEMPLLRNTNTFEVLNALCNEGIINPEEGEVLGSALHFYRRLLSRVRLFTGHATAVLDTESPYAEKIATIMGMKSVEEIVERLKEHREKVLKIYKERD